MVKLDQEETEILEAFEAGELQRSADADEVLKRHQEYAAATLRRDARVNVRLTNRYLSRLKKKRHGTGYPLPNTGIKYSPPVCGGRAAREQLDPGPPVPRSRS